MTKDRLEEIYLLAHEARSHSWLKNPIDIAEALGYKVILSNLKEIPAFCDYNSGEIYISNAADKYSQQILCAHELGHLILDNCNSVSLFDETIDSESEVEANAFAYYLYPKAFVRLNNEDISTGRKFNRFVASLIRYK